MSALILTAIFCIVAGLLTAVPAFAADPAITSFTPTSGPMGTTVTITGTGFAAPATVKFHGVPAPNPTVVSATKITVKVPAPATTGKISVTTAGGTATSAGTYTVTAGAALSPISGPPTTPTTVSLSGFAASEAIDVYVDSAEVQLAVATSTGLLSTSIKIPASATPGVHYVTAVGRRSGSAAQAPFTVRTNWVRSGFDTAGTGNNPYENVLSPTTVGKLRELWRFTPGAPAEDTPIVVGNVVYAAYYGGTVKAVDAATGHQRWSTSINGSFVYSPPTVANGTLFIGSTDGKVYALNAATGAILWTFTTGNAIYSGPASSATPSTSAPTTRASTPSTPPRRLDLVLHDGQRGLRHSGRRRQQRLHRLARRGHLLPRRDHRRPQVVARDERGGRRLRGRG